MKKNYIYHTWRDSLMCKKKYDVNINFIGTSSETVTGSCYVLTYKKQKILIDCGMYQGANKLKSYQTNKNMFRNMRVTDIDAIVTTHNHIDHIGNLPYIYALGCKSKIYGTDKSIPFWKEIFKDSYKINLKDAEYLSRLSKSKVKPLFAAHDMSDVIENAEMVQFGKTTRVTENISIHYIQAGHIFGSAQLIIKVRDKNFKKNIFLPSVHNFLFMIIR